MKFAFCVFALTVSPAFAQSQAPPVDKWGCAVAPWTVTDPATGKQAPGHSSFGLVLEHRCLSTTPNVVRMMCSNRCNIPGMQADYFVQAGGSPYDGYFYIPKDLVEGAKLFGAVPAQ